MKATERKSTVEWPSEAAQLEKLWSCVRPHETGVPRPDENQRCYSELSEVSPGFYLGPESAIDNPKKMANYGVALVVTMNGSEDSYTVWEELPAGQRPTDSDTIAFIDDGSAFVERSLRKGRSAFLEAVMEHIEVQTEWFVESLSSNGASSGALPRPLRKIFRLSIAADDNQFYDISSHFHETSTLIEVVMSGRRFIEERAALIAHNTSKMGGAPSVEVNLSEQCCPSLVPETSGPVRTAWRPRNMKAETVVPRTQSGSSSFRSTTTVSTLAKNLPPPPSVAVHCLVGMSRSVAVTAAYYMKYTRLPLLVVLNDLIKVRRPIACPNPGFMAQLRSWEACGYATAKDDNGCEALVTGIRSAGRGLMGSDTVPVLQKLLSLRTLIDVYLMGTRYSAERLNLGKVFWGLVLADSETNSTGGLTICDVLELILSILYRKVADGVYVDCPGLLLGVCQIVKGTLLHAGAHTQALDDGVSALIALTPEQFLLRIIVGPHADNDAALPTESAMLADTSVETQKALRNIWGELMPLPQNAILSRLYCQCFVVTSVATRSASKIVKHVADTFCGKHTCIDDNLTADEKDEADYCREPLTRFLDAALKKEAIT